MLNMSDNLKEMWRRLEVRFGNEGKNCRICAKRLKLVQTCARKRRTSPVDFFLILLKKLI